MKHLEKYLLAEGGSSHREIAFLVNDLENLCDKYGDVFSKPWENTDEISKAKEDYELSYTTERHISELFESLYRNIRRKRGSIKQTNDLLKKSITERVRERLACIINKAATVGMSKGNRRINVSEWTKADHIEARSSYDVSPLHVPYSFIPRIKQGLTFIDNKVVLKSWDEDKSVDGCVSEACQYYAMNRHKYWETRIGFVAWMSVEDGPTIAAIRDERDKACAAVRGKVRKETLKRMGLA